MSNLKTIKLYPGINYDKDALIPNWKECIVEHPLFNKIKSSIKNIDYVDNKLIIQL